MGGFPKPGSRKRRRPMLEPVPLAVDGGASSPLESDASDLERGERISGIEERARPALAPLESIAPLERVDVGELGELEAGPGALVGDAYRILRVLGSGGMGVVALARDERLDRLVAIKFIRPGNLERADLRELFETEARAMARVTHPNVLTVHAYGEHGGRPYFVMEYVDGPTVEEWLEARPRARPDIEDAVRIIEQACAGVDAIHAAQTVHRDLKPSNLLLRGSGAWGVGGVGLRAIRVAVSDLGVARILSPFDREESSCLVGSSAYMAPEASLGKDAEPALATRRDVYALGCIAYELLVGRPPFDAPSEVALISKHLLEPPPVPSSVREDLACGYDEVIARALAKDPHDRWPSAGELARALLAVRDDADMPRRILIADDDDDWRTILHTALASSFPHARIDVVHDGESAIAAARSGAYSVILIDLIMPEMDGMELTGRLRAHASSRGTPIIVMTAAGGPGEWRRLSRLGADAFLVKPVEPEDIAMLMRRTIRSRRERERRGAWA